MVRLTAPNGATVDVSEEKAGRLAAQGFRPADGEAVATQSTSDTESDYSALKVADLKAEIEMRNDGREGDAVLSTEGKKADLIATLEADDADES
jgi:hypothetical protein